jgi:hypothetical protein
MSEMMRLTLPTFRDHAAEAHAAQSAAARTGRGSAAVRGTIAATLLLALLPAMLAAQDGKSAANVAAAPPAAERPDLNGVWQALGTAHYDLEPHVARHALMVRAGPHGPLPAKEVLPLGAVGAVPPGLGVVEGGRIPYQEWALEQRDKHRAAWLESDPEIKCYLPGVPRATYMPYPFRILQSDSAVFIAYEYAGATRNVFLEDPGPAPVDSWMGQSYGRWEGDTLVVEVTGFNGRTWLDRSGNFHSDKLKVTERYTPAGPNHLMYEAVLEDPDVYTRPWKIRMPLYRRMEADAQILDFKCVEFVEELIYGELRKSPLPR